MYDKKRLENTTESEKQWLSELSHRLYDLRQEKGWSLEDLSKQCKQKYGVEINKGTWSRYEKGQMDPSFTKIKMLAEIYGVSTDYLIGLTDKPHGSNDNKADSGLDSNHIRMIDAYDKASDMQRKLVNNVLNIRMKPDKKETAD